MKLLRRAMLPVQRAFTLIELMVVIALVGIILALAAPSFNEMIGMQRLRAVGDQLVTDLQFLRGEANSRNQFMGFGARSEAGEPVSCYGIFSNSANPMSGDSIDPTACNCAAGVGSACSGTHRELRTVQIPRNLGIDLKFPPFQGGFVVASPINGGVEFKPPNSALWNDKEFCVEVHRTPRGRLRTSINAVGKVSVCSPDGSVPGVAVCQAYDASLKNCKAVS